MARCAWNTTRNAFQKAAPTANRSFVLRKPGRARQFYMPTMPPDRSPKMGMEHAIKTAQQNGVAVVGISRMGHSGAISYFVQQAARAGLVGISMCQSDQWWCRLAARIYYGTNPLAFAAPGEGDEILTFDMATTVQAWGKVLDARSRNMSIPDTGRSIKRCTNNRSVRGTCSAPRRRAEGYGLMMMIDVLSGVLLGLPFGRQVSSMYDDLHAGRNLGQLHLLLIRTFLLSEIFRQHLSQTMRELNAITRPFLIRFLLSRTGIRILNNAKPPSKASKLLMIFTSI